MAYAPVSALAGKARVCECYRRYQLAASFRKWLRIGKFKAMLSLSALFMKTTTLVMGSQACRHVISPSAPIALQHWTKLGRQKEAINPRSLRSAMSIHLLQSTDLTGHHYSRSLCNAPLTRTPSPNLSLLHPPSGSKAHISIHSPSRILRPARPPGPRGSCHAGSGCLGAGGSFLRGFGAGGSFLRDGRCGGVWWGG